MDAERAWRAMKAHILTKRSHGQDDLLLAMTRIELDSPSSAEEAGEIERLAGLAEGNGHTERPSRQVPA